MMDKITIDKLHIYAYHGVHESEKENGQNFYVSAVLYTDLYRAGHTDDLGDTVSYSDAAKLINRVFVSEKYDLIEKAAYVCAEAVLDSFPAVHAVDLKVSKPEAPIGLDFDDVSVDITLSCHKAYLSFGSNMGDRMAYIESAIEKLKNTPGIKVIRRSDIIETDPYGPVEQDKFLNGVLEIETYLTPEALLDALHVTEDALGRKRTVRWGPRTVDLDILLYDDLVMCTEDLVIPHPDMKNRDFVLKPLCEIAPNLIHPVLRISISEMLDHLLFSAASRATVNS